MTASKRSAPGSSGACRATTARAGLPRGSSRQASSSALGRSRILGSIANGLTGNIELLAIKSALDGVASIAFAATLGAGVALSAVTVLTSRAIAAGASLLRGTMDQTTILAITSAGGIMLMGVALRLLDLKAVRVASFLPALLLAPLFIRLADVIRDLLS